MRIFMLGWEFPPFIAGGLGTACYGLTRALDRLGHKVSFVLPRAVDRAQAEHIRLLCPDSTGPATPAARTDAGPTQSTTAAITLADVPGEHGPVPGFTHLTMHALPAKLTSPYAPFGPDPTESTGPTAAGAGTTAPARPAAQSAPAASGRTAGFGLVPAAAAGHAYAGDLFVQAELYTELVLRLARVEPFDVIHAHDWLTFPAGEAVAQATGRPLVVHVHSTEFDRAGDWINQRVYDIERAGMHAADRVICVSQLTRSICEKRYGVPSWKIDVVYNGIEAEAAQPVRGSEITRRDKIVLFLGRITMQKGPEYFLAAAKRVLEKMDNVKFVVAGSGDLAVRMIEQSAEMGIGHRVLFTGFLRGRDVERVFALADCYVMPSVSEPFGLVALEAIQHDVPVIISRQSGVSEVLRHVLKVDFWDVDEMANKILAVLRHDSLRRTLREHGPMELRQLTWTGAAEKCVASYRRAIAQRAHRHGASVEPSA